MDLSVCAGIMVGSISQLDSQTGRGERSERSERRELERAAGLASPGEAVPWVPEAPCLLSAQDSGLSLLKERLNRVGAILGGRKA